MRNVHLLLISANPAVQETVRAAAASAFPSAQVAVAGDFAAAVDDLPGALNLLVLDRPDDGILAKALQAADANGLPRRAVVVLAEQPSDLAETVTPEDLNPRCLARIFRSTVQQYELLRENCGLRGDLKTVARRISHELRTPVSCIYTSSDLLEEMPMGQDAARRETANLFRQSSTEISQIIDRVSFLLRASTDPITPEPVEMGCIVTAALRQLDAEIRRGGAVVLQPVAWPEVRGVRAWLQVVWWNLLHNAIRHGGPSLVIKIACVRDGGHCRFSVTDQGPGVATAERPGLFVPFENLHETRSRGLGLSIVHRLVGLQNGACGYEAAPEGGASFHFSLPTV